MKPYQERAVAELAELQGRIDRLSDFMRSALTVDAVERELLHKQHYAMVEYAAILRQRVRRFEV